MSLPYSQSSTPGPILSQFSPFLIITPYFCKFHLLPSHRPPVPPRWGRVDIYLRAKGDSLEAEDYNETLRKVNLILINCYRGKICVWEYSDALHAERQKLTALLNPLSPHTSVTRINKVVPVVPTSRLIFWHVTRVVQWEFINV